MSQKPMLTSSLGMNFSSVLLAACTTGSKGLRFRVGRHQDPRHTRVFRWTQ